MSRPTDPTVPAGAPPPDPGRPASRPAPMPPSSAADGPPEDHDARDVGLDLLDQGVAPCGAPGRPHARPQRGRLAITAHVTWVDGQPAEALRRTQGRALHAALVALAAHAHPDRQATPPAPSE